MNLEFEIRQKDLTGDGDIPSQYKERIYNFLSGKGLIICPSDTCYSVATMCKFDDMGDTLNTILERDDMPFSVAVNDMKTISKYVVEDNSQVFNKLLDWFTPGPITCIGVIIRECRDFCKIIHAEKDDTVGVRIPDSKIERTIAEIANCPITTVPVKMGKSTPIKDYNEAVCCIGKSIEEKGLTEKVKVAGIETTLSFVEKLSTVVRVDSTVRELQIVRPGYISEIELNLFLRQECLDNWKIVKGVI
ncbi:MAG: Sua5/YciO/YrdC/YwlC family protein [Tannerella sp.]|jgi:L-threonylcarbamoyladenylate synthase|nr:Sua5/YciO/YrdC/YwlC family protein [Tannerella sp.]